MLFRSSILFISPIGLPPIHVLERFSQFLPYMAVMLSECLRYRLRSDYSPEMRSAYVAEQQRYCLRYVQNTSCHLFPLCGSSDVLPEHLPDWSSFLPQSISSDAETMPRHHRISLSDLPDHRNSTPGYEPEYPDCGTDLPYSSRACPTMLWILPAYIPQSSPAFRTGGYGKHHAPQYHVLPFPYGNMGNNWSVYMEASPRR